MYVRLTLYRLSLKLPPARVEIGHGPALTSAKRRWKQDRRGPAGHQFLHLSQL